MKNKLTNLILKYEAAGIDTTTLTELLEDFLIVPKKSIEEKIDWDIVPVKHTFNSVKFIGNLHLRASFEFNVIKALRAYPDFVFADKGKDLIIEEIFCLLEK